ncbi:trypsin-like peptidase domain-containing protein, partial [Candidatus Gracilibacteria bacterium]|nr:trypsin-like peptidase domain-containing protein [Candidatus Gracilibacteria bacterium]
MNGRPRQAASGIVYATDHVLTADHVLEREDDLTVVTHDGRTLAAQFVGRDSASDLAVLRVPNLQLEALATAQQPGPRGAFCAGGGTAWGRGDGKPGDCECGGRAVAHQARRGAGAVHPNRCHTLPWFFG